MAQPLAGVRVVDLTTGIAGPYATKMLADGGADVVKIEPPGGDPLRSWCASGTPIREGDDGPLFRYLNTSKRSAIADLDTTAGRELVRRLARTADLVVESLGPGRLDRLQLGLAALQEDNPRLSIASLSPWGQDGPWAHRPSTEFTLQSATGATHFRGLRDRPPVGAGGQLGEWIAGSFFATAALTCWMSARLTGHGQRVDVSAFEALVTCMSTYRTIGQQWLPPMVLARQIELPSIEPASDGWVGFCTITSQQYHDFWSMLGEPELADDPRFVDIPSRVDNLVEMQRHMHGWTKQRGVDDIVELASLFRIPVAPIGTGETLPRMDHFVERGVFVTNPHGFVQPRVPYAIGGCEVRPFEPAPAAGHHQVEIEREADLRAPVASSTERAERGDRAERGTRPLAGLRVVDFTAFWAGPFATAYLADLGADVVKVESVQRPDGMRFAGSARTDDLWEWNPVFHGANPGKRAVTLRLDDEDGIALARRLVEGADVVIENFSARVMEGFGLGWDDVHTLNPRAIMVRMPAFGLDGPWRDRTGFAMTIEQVSGLAWVTGYEDLPLVPRGVCDPVGSMHALFALFQALAARDADGEGRLVEATLVEAALNIAAEQVIEHSANGVVLGRMVNRNVVHAPQGVYRCLDDDEGRDRWVTVSVATEEHWTALRSVLGDPPSLSDGALGAATGRRAAHGVIDEVLAAWSVVRTAEDAAEQLVAAGVPAHPVTSSMAVLPNPQLEARGYLQPLDHQFTGRTGYPGVGFVFSDWGPHLHTRPAPTLGQDNAEVLGDELGLSPEQLADLANRAIIGSRPAGW